MFLIDDRHLQRVHGITKEQYKTLYPKIALTSENTKLKLQHCMELMNNNKEWDRKESNYERELQSFLTENNVLFETHKRDILDNGKEIDIFIPNKNIGIEFNGNIWHTNWFGGKDKHYHLNKTLQCNENGVKLIQIFEDEYVYNKQIVLNKINYRKILFSNILFL